MRIHTRAALLVGIIFLTNCASATRPDVILHEGPEGGVFLERLPDRAVQATHPIKLDSTVVSRVLRGVHVTGAKTAAQALFGEETSGRVFSEEDIAFLAPLISSALSQAGSQQQVRFRLVHLSNPLRHPERGGAGIGSSSPPSTGPQTETTAGTLYAHGLSLHMTLTEYDHRAVRPDTISGPNRYYPDATGLAQRKVRFSPQSALRPDSYRRPGDSDTTIVIDYESLAKQPQFTSSPTTSAESASPLIPKTTAISPSVTATESVTPSRESISQEYRSASSSPSAESATPPVSLSSQAEDLQALKDLIIKKDLELESMKTDLRLLRQQLDDRDTQSEALKKKKKPAPKSQSTLP
jgi:uncharacterized coiled-coil protein SlyX